MKDLIGIIKPILEIVQLIYLEQFDYNPKILIKVN